MFKQKWDNENNSILLSNKISEDESIVSPRPVFFEELDLLGFGDHWNYPKCEEPLLWAIGRRYYYKGIIVAEVKGGNIYEKPILNIMQRLTLEPVNVEKLIDNNIEALKVLEGEAIDFIQDTYKRYKNKVDLFSVAFSGGKDSQVVLDLISRVLAPDEYFAIFTDTTMEIPFTYETVENTKKKYKEIYPNFQFYTAKPEEHSLEYWETFGPPSRTHRWCCSVCKTVPFSRLMRSFRFNTILPKVLVYDGVRSEESTSRGKYKRIAHEAKHPNIINAEVIKDWNLPEVFLYIFYRNIELNNGYRFGLTRIGCSVCPFASIKNEYIQYSLFNNELDPFLYKISNYVKNIGFSSSKKIKEFIANGNWKGRTSSNGLDISSNINYTTSESNLKATISNSSESLFEWLKVLGDIHIINFPNKSQGEIRLKNKTLLFNYEKRDTKQHITFKSINGDVIAKNKLKKVLNKVTYCVHCGTCEVECPSNALRVFPSVTVDKGKCIHCLKCIEFVEKGCLKAKFINISGGKNMSNHVKGFGRYFKFGMRNAWLIDYLKNTEKWMIDNNLGNKQLQSFTRWLIDAGLFDEKSRNATELCKSIKNIIKDENNTWLVIWTNLYQNSHIVKWYLDKISWNNKMSKNEMLKYLYEDFENLSEGTLNNDILALLNTFENSPLGNSLRIGRIEKTGNMRYIIKLGINKISPISIAYSLYKYAEYKKRYNFTVSEFYSENSDGGPYKLFGISREIFENILRGLQENINQIVRVDLTANLDNIFLQENLTSIEVLKILTE